MLQNVRNVVLLMRKEGVTIKVKKICGVLLLVIVILVIYKVRNADSSILNISLASRYTEKSSFPENVYGTVVYTSLIDEGPARPGTLRLIKYIVIHETDNFAKGVGAKNHAYFLKNNNKSTTSWHYTVDDHEIYHHIPDNEKAHHAGDKMGNEHGIGIELCVNSDGDYNKTFENAAKLVAYLLKEYKLDMDAIKTHRDFNGKDCPHKMLNDNRFNEFKERVTFYLIMGN